MINNLMRRGQSENYNFAVFYCFPTKISMTPTYFQSLFTIAPFTDKTLRLTYFVSFIFLSNCEEFLFACSHVRLILMTSRFQTSQATKVSTNQKREGNIRGKRHKANLSTLRKRQTLLKFREIYEIKID